MMAATLETATVLMAFLLLIVRFQDVRAESAVETGNKVITSNMQPAEIHNPADAASSGLSNFSSGPLHAAAADNRINLLRGDSALPHAHGEARQGGSAAAGYNDNYISRSAVTAAADEDKDTSAAAGTATADDMTPQSWQQHQPAELSETADWVAVHRQLRSAARKKRSCVTTSFKSSSTDIISGTTFQMGASLFEPDNAGFASFSIFVDNSTGIFIKPSEPGQPPTKDVSTSQVISVGYTQCTQKTGTAPCTSEPIFDRCISIDAVDANFKLTVGKRLSGTLTADFTDPDGWTSIVSQSSDECGNVKPVRGDPANPGKPVTIHVDLTFTCRPSVLKVTSYNQKCSIKSTSSEGLVFITPLTRIVQSRTAATDNNMFCPLDAVLDVKGSITAKTPDGPVDLLAFVQANPESGFNQVFRGFSTSTDITKTSLV